ncbi:hypothetical protein EXS45_02085 [Candidatus Nomurabacteria bacterium]|nr:hypothetical protein [Candidatus Nomurabacteria bacterium]
MITSKEVLENIRNMITRYTIKRLEKALNEGSDDYLIIPIMATPAEAEAIREWAKREGRKTMGVPINTREVIESNC